jgi:hypothetical protein
MQNLALVKFVETSCSGSLISHPCGSTGENVEPQEIEEAAMQSKLIQNIMVVGQVCCL